MSTYTLLYAHYPLLIACVMLHIVFPTAQYTIPKMFILPTVYYTAVALVSLVLIFPESLNHVWLYVLSPSTYPFHLTSLFPIIPQNHTL
jgi:hypothetical protein